MFSETFSPPITPIAQIKNGTPGALAQAMEVDEVTRTIIGAAMEVHRLLGPGFVESIYRNALYRELVLRGLHAVSESEVQVKYKDFVVGRHRLDLVVNDTVIVELKAAHGIVDVYLSQALSYLKATNLPVALIVNFGEPSLAWKRLIKSAKSA